jgi:hypothetical protein
LYVPFALLTSVELVITNLSAQTALGVVDGVILGVIEIVGVLDGVVVGVLVKVGVIVFVGVVVGVVVGVTSGGDGCGVRLTSGTNPPYRYC